MEPIRAFPELTLEEEEALREETRDKSRNDLHYLAKHLLGFDKLTNHYHREMCIDIDSKKHKFKLLLHPRGHYKSTLASESYSILKLLRNPDEHILITNAKLGNSQKFLRSIANQFTSNPKFRWAWRDWWIKNYATNYHKQDMKDKLDWVVRNTQDEFTLLRSSMVREASITTASIDSSMVSQHYSTIIGDDIINREWVRSQELVERSILYFKDLLDLLNPDGEMVIIGTRWSHADLYAWILEEFGEKAVIRAPEGTVDDDILYRSKNTDSKKSWMISVKPTSVEDPIFPEEFTPEVLQSLYDAKGSYEFGAQYLLNPTPEEAQKFHKDWINWMDDSIDISALNTCITVDPAVSLDSRADRTAIVVCGYDKENNMYLLDGLNERLTEDELLEKLFEFATIYSDQSRFLLPIGFEAVGFQQTYIYNFERIMRERGKFFAVEPVKRRSRVSKEERILRLVPRVKSGFYMPRNMPRFSKREGEYDLAQRVLWELTRFPFAGFDDLADALADQLDLVQATGLPTIPAKRIAGKVVDFVHPSTIEDKKRRKRLAATANKGVVR